MSVPNVVSHIDRIENNFTVRGGTDDYGGGLVDKYTIGRQEGIVGNGILSLEPHWHCQAEIGENQKQHSPAGVQDRRGLFLRCQAPRIRAPRIYQVEGQDVQPIAKSHSEVLPARAKHGQLFLCPSLRWTSGRKYPKAGMRKVLNLSNQILPMRRMTALNVIKNPPSRPRD